MRAESEPTGRQRRRRGEPRRDNEIMIMLDVLTYNIYVYKLYNVYYYIIIGEHLLYIKKGFDPRVHARRINASRPKTPYVYYSEAAGLWNIESVNSRHQKS